MGDRGRPDGGGVREGAGPLSSAPEGLLRRRLRELGLGEATSVEPVTGGFAARAFLARLATGEAVFAKVLPAPPGDDVFVVEAAGLEALRAAGARTPDVLAVGVDVLVLGRLRPRRDDAPSWERLAHDVAGVHSVTAPQHGWDRDGWLGTYRQVNDREDDGHLFFARHRLLRWLPEPRLRAKLDQGDRRGLERLCERLPELVPGGPACLTHGDLWAENVMSGADGAPVLIDPAVSFTWPEADLSHLWSSPRPPEADRFFDVYAELRGLEAGWRDRLPLLHLRQLLALVAMFDHDWGSTETVKELLAPFRDG